MIFKRKKKRATQEDLGKKVQVLWNPQGVRDFGEKPAWRDGVIDHVSEDGGYCIDLHGALMVCGVNGPYRSKVNPFKYVRFV